MQIITAQWGHMKLYHKKYNESFLLRKIQFFTIYFCHQSVIFVKDRSGSISYDRSRTTSLIPLSLRGEF